MNEIPKWKKKLFGCHVGAVFTNGYEFRFDTVTGQVRWRIYNRWERIKRWPHDFVRWTLPARLCRIASWLRGEKWYVADAWHGVPGNRISEINQQMRDAIICTKHEEWDDLLASLEPLINELCQTAGESWGHIYPNEKKQ